MSDLPESLRCDLSITAHGGSDLVVLGTSANPLVAVLPGLWGYGPRVLLFEGSTAFLYQCSANYSGIEGLLGSARVEDLNTTRPLFGRRMKVRFPDGAAIAIDGKSNVETTLARLHR